MRLSNVSYRNGLLALTVVAAGALLASAAIADPGHGRGHGQEKNRRGGYEYRGGSYRGDVRYRNGGGGQVRYRDDRSWRRSGPSVRIDARYRSGGDRVYVRSAPQRVYVQRAPHVVYAQPARIYSRCEPRYVSYRSPRVIVVRPAPYARIGVSFGHIGISAILGGHHRWNDCDYGCNFCDAHFSSYGAYEAHVRSCDYRPRDCEIQCRQWDDAGYDQYRGRDDGRCGEDQYRDDDRRYDDDDRYYDEDDD